MNDTRPDDDSADTDDVDRRRMWWHSRRGLRELDLMLLPFMEDVYSQLSEPQKAVYKRLLDNEDTELLVWFTGRGVPLDPELAAMIDFIKAGKRPVA